MLVGLRDGSTALIYTIALTQIREQTEGRAYYERKRSQGKTKREGLWIQRRRRVRRNAL